MSEAAKPDTAMTDAHARGVMWAHSLTSFERCELHDRFEMEVMMSGRGFSEGLLPGPNCRAYARHIHEILTGDWKDGDGRRAEVFWEDVLGAAEKTIWEFFTGAVADHPWAKDVPEARGVFITVINFGGSGWTYAALLHTLTQTSLAPS